MFPCGTFASSGLPHVWVAGEALLQGRTSVAPVSGEERADTWFSLEQTPAYSLRPQVSVRDRLSLGFALC